MSQEELVAAKKEQASQSVLAFDAQEEAATNAALAELSTGGLSSNGVATSQKPGITVALFDPSAIDDPNQEFSIQAPVDATGFTPQVSLTGAGLSAVSESLGGGSPVALSAAPVSDELLGLVGEILSAAQRAPEDSSGNAPPPPVLASAPLSISLYRADGTPLKNVQLDKPITLTLKGSAPDNVSCAFFNTSINEWSTEGVRRVYPDPSSTALVCETMHLSIFGGIAGAFNDIAQTLVCSNIKALMTVEIWMNIVREPSWALETGGIALWSALGLSALAIIVSVTWDIREHREVSFLVDEHGKNVKDLPPQEKFKVMAHLHRSKTESSLGQKDEEEEEEEEKKHKMRKCLMCMPCIVCCGFLFYIIKAMWQTLLKLAVKTLKMPNSVHTLLLSLPDAPEHFTKMCVKHSVSAKVGIDRQSMNSSKAYGKGESEEHAEMVNQHFQDDMVHFLETAFVGRMMLMVVAMHPWMLIFQFSAFVSHTARVVLAIAEMFGATAMGALFYQTAGGALSKLKPPPEECKPRSGLLTEILQAATVATVTCFAADFFVAFLALVRFADYEALEKLPEDERKEHLRHIDNRIRLFWVLSVGYILGCIGIIMAFLANVTEVDAGKWLIASGICLLEDFIIIPLALGLIISLIATLFACCSPKLKKVREEGRSNKYASRDLEQARDEHVLKVKPESELREVATPTSPHLDLRTLYIPQDDYDRDVPQNGLSCTC